MGIFLFFLGILTDDERDGPDDDPGDAPLLVLVFLVEEWCWADPDPDDPASKLLLRLRPLAVPAVVAVGPSLGLSIGRPSLAHCLSDEMSENMMSEEYEDWS